jgi:hypothetical protein
MTLPPVRRDMTRLISWLVGAVLALLAGFVPLGYYRTTGVSSAAWRPKPTSRPPS